MENSITTGTDIISAMAQYNFQYPLDVTVIYDDDDDEGQERNEAPIQKQQDNKLSCNKIKKDEETMINQVAHNMASIMESYVAFVKLAKISINQQQVNHYKFRYFAIKLYYFNKSLVISETLLLPQERNKQFLDVVIHKTIKMSKMQSNDIYWKFRKLYDDFIQWTKLKIEKMRIQPPHSTSYCSQATLPNFSNHEEKILNKGSNSQNLNTFNVFSGGPPSKEITVNVDPGVIRNIYINNISTQFNATCQSGVQNFNQTLFTPMNNYSTCNLPNPRYLAVTNSEESSNRASKKKDIPPNNGDDLVIQTDQQEISTCLISRYNGFNSPLTFNALLKEMRRNAPTQPIANISYPVNTTLQLCVICGKATNMGCFGCFQYYYCSLACQSSHWEVHKWTCQLNILYNDDKE